MFGMPPEMSGVGFDTSMFQLTGYRTPTIQRLRLGAGRDGRLGAIGHDVVEQTSTVKEFAEQTAVVTRMMYAAPNRRETTNGVSKTNAIAGRICASVKLA